MALCGFFEKWYTLFLSDCKRDASRINLCCSESVRLLFISVADKSGAGAREHMNKGKHWPVWSAVWGVLITTVMKVKPTGSQFLNN